MAGDESEPLGAAQTSASDGDMPKTEGPSTVKDAQPLNARTSGDDSTRTEPAGGSSNPWQAEAAGWVSGVRKQQKLPPEERAQAQKELRQLRMIDRLLCGGWGFVAVTTPVFLVLLVLFHREPNPQKHVMTSEVLGAFNGEKGAPLYLAILGQVFDVSRKPEFYGKGSGYHHFVGRDATRGFVTGDKSGPGLTDDLEGLTDGECASLVHWLEFYHKEYPYKGRVAGAFFNSDGKRKKALQRVEQQAARAADAEEVRKKAEAKHPRCNVRWTESEGGFVSCSDGLRPRKVFDQQADGAPTARCACFKELGWSDMRQVYPGCRPEAFECQTSPPKVTGRRTEDQQAEL